VSTPQLRDRIFELLLDGVPLRVMRRVDGMPSRPTIYRWRQLGLPATRRMMAVVSLKNRTLSPIAQLFIKTVCTVAKPPTKVKNHCSVTLR
jgi:hypothetical protein